MIRHIITSEYPPQPGGVSDYTRMVAEGLASAGDEVHVWCPPAAGATPEIKGVTVHRDCGSFTAADLRCVGRELGQLPSPRRVLVQWVPHGFGFRSMNLMFCLWLWLRAFRHRDEIELMVHEPYLSFGEGSWKQDLVAVVHRLMTIVLLRATRRVWISIPAWEACWRPYKLGRAVKFTWLPVGSNIPIAGGVAAPELRARYVNDRELLIGHFGSYDPNTAQLLSNTVSDLMKNGMKSSLLLLGHGSAKMRSTLIDRQPSLAHRIHATGTLDAEELSRHISACDVMVQPYIDGVSSRRTSTMVALAHGIPVVTTRGRLTEPLWIQNDAVALAPVESVSELAQTATRLLTDPAARQRLSLGARAFYSEHFDSARTIARLRGA